MSRAGFAIAMTLAALYQILAAPLYRLGDITPSFVPAALLYFAYFARPGDLIALVIALSIPLDVLSLAPPGTHAIGLVSMVLLVSRLQGWFVLASGTLRLVAILPAIALEALCRGAYAAAFETGAGLRVSFAEIVYTSAVALLLHGILDVWRAPLGWARQRSHA